jgi:type I restriction enzyme, S subunit
MVKKVKLSSICEILDNKRIPLSDNERQIRIKNKKIDVLYPYYGATKQVGYIDDYIFDDELILLGEDGVMFYDISKPKAYLIKGKSWVNNHAHVLKINNTKANTNYVLYYLNIFNYQGYVSGSTRLKLNKSKMSEIPIPLPTLEKQNQIAKTLDKANELVELRKESITKLDALAKSIFIDMFGDPVENPMNWELNKLSEFGNCKNGLNFNSKRNECNIKCLGVGDFKNLTTIRNIELLQTISIEKKPTKEYLLQNGDIIFVRSNGSKDLVGRCVEIYPNETEVTFSGFCIRFRLSTDLILIPYLLNVLKSKSMRQNMIGRGANIQNLNQQILLGLNIPLPPIELQNKFAKIIEKIEEQKSLYTQELEKLQENFDALLQKSFQE